MQTGAIETLAVEGGSVVCMVEETKQRLPLALLVLFNRPPLRLFILAHLASQASILFGLA
jgi:hypothetical protein